MVVFLRMFSLLPEGPSARRVTRPQGGHLLLAHVLSVLPEGPSTRGVAGPRGGRLLAHVLVLEIGPVGHQGLQHLLPLL